ISDVMHGGDDVPRVPPEAGLTAALVEMTRKRLGMTAVVDAEQHLLGVFTDGDLRRALDDVDVNLRGARVAELMTRGPKTIGPDKLAAEAAQLMEKHQINALLVVDEAARGWCAQHSRSAPCTRGLIARCHSPPPSRSNPCTWPIFLPISSPAPRKSAW